MWDDWLVLAWITQTGSYLPARARHREQIIPRQYYEPAGGLHSFLQMRADEVFLSLKSAHDREGRKGKLRYIFEFEVEGPVLKTVSLV